MLQQFQFFPHLYLSLTYAHLERDADQNNLPLPLPSTQEFLHSEPIKSPSLVYLL